MSEYTHEALADITCIRLDVADWIVREQLKAYASAWRAQVEGLEARRDAAQSATDAAVYKWNITADALVSCTNDLSNALAERDRLRAELTELRADLDAANERADNFQYALDASYAAKDRLD